MSESHQLTQKSSDKSEAPVKVKRKRKRRRSDGDPSVKRFEGGEWITEDKTAHQLVHFDSRWTMILIPDATTMFKVIGRARFWPLSGHHLIVNGLRVSSKKAQELGGVMVWSPSSHSLQTISVSSSQKKLKVDPLSVSKRLQESVTVDPYFNLDDPKKVASRLEDLLTGKEIAGILLCCRDERSVVVDVLRSLSEFDGLFGSCRANTDYELSYCDQDSLTIKADPLTETVSDFLKDIKRDPESVVMVIGGKNTGKSTTVRHLMNAALLSDDHGLEGIAVFDCDPGQTEFTPPAFVSITHVTEPLFGPPFTHSTHKPISQCFYGALSPSDDPDFYLKCLTKVYSDWRASSVSNKCPLLINTMGWPEGLGRRFIIDTIRMTNPCAVFQLSSMKDHDNFKKPMSADHVMKEKGWSSCKKTELKYKLRVLSPLFFSKASGMRMSAVDNRNLTLYAHLSNILRNQPEFQQPKYLPWYDSYQNGRDFITCLTSVCPTRLPWSKVAVHCMVADSVLSSSVILLSINASLVALLNVDEAKWKELVVPDTPSDHPRILRKKPDCPALGMGLVRGIDPVTREILILSSLQQQELQTVNCILSGRLDFPVSLMLPKKTRDGDAPYVEDTVNLGIGRTSIKKERPHLKGPHR